MFENAWDGERASKPVSVVDFVPRDVDCADKLHFSEQLFAYNLAVWLFTMGNLLEPRLPQYCHRGDFSRGFSESCTV